MFYQHLILRNKICGVTCFNQLHNKHTNETQVYLFINGNTEIGIQLLLIINLLMFIYMFYCIKQQYKQLVIHTFILAVVFSFPFPFLHSLSLSFTYRTQHTHICARFPTYYPMNNTLHSLHSLFHVQYNYNKLLEIIYAFSKLTINYNLIDNRFGTVQNITIFLSSNITRLTRFYRINK